MDPVTHMFTGACLSRACAFPRRARYATLACVFAAELPDADIVYRLGGPVVYFQHHRGWTHALWSLPLQAALTVALVWLWHRIRGRHRRHRTGDHLPPLRWLALGGMALVALLSHILLDWTNNYGVRPFAPFNPRWYSADLVFIVEPTLLLLLSGALVLPILLSLTDAEIGARKPSSRGRGLAIAALTLTAALWLWRFDRHAAAIEIAARNEFSGGDPVRIAAEPYPVNPFRWHVIVETPANFQTGSVDTRIPVFETSPQQIYGKPRPAAVTLAAKGSRLGRVYLDWSRFPLVDETGNVAETHPEIDPLPGEAVLHVVRFRDLRYMYDALGLRGSTEPPLSGEVWVDGAQRIVRSSFGDAQQR